MNLHEPAHGRKRAPLNTPADFESLTEKALQTVHQVSSHIGEILRLLEDCEPLPHMAHEQERGASYEVLDLIADLAGIRQRQRRYWYHVVERIPLTSRHVIHIVHKLKRRAV